VIARDLAPLLRELAKLYPIVTVTGPRQSGKTTLCQKTFPRKPYVSLEPIDVRSYAAGDPRGFLQEHAQGAVIDEVQHVPELLSYLQAEVDHRPEPGRFVLTGSQHFGLSQSISQSLAGRTGVLTLLAPSLAELRRFPSAPRTLFETLWSGAYPRIFDRGIPPGRFLSDYVTTYVQRDVRQVLAVGDLKTFTGFLRLCASHAGREVNLSALGADAGVTHKTARAWLSVLEASYLVFLIPSWQRNFRKQVVKRPKLAFFDSGLLCHLLGIGEPEQLRHHPLRGAIFESWVASEVYKQRAHRGLEPRLFHHRDAKGLEVDLVLEAESALALIESKSGATVPNDALAALQRAAELARRASDARSIEAVLVYGGDARQARTGLTVLPWSGLAKGPWAGVPSKRRKGR
jgi:hypothetical protein